MFAWSAVTFSIFCSVEDEEMPGRSSSMHDMQKWDASRGHVRQDNAPWLYAVIRTDGSVKVIEKNAF